MSSRVRVNDKWCVLAYYINEANVDQQSQKVWWIDYASIWIFLHTRCPIANIILMYLCVEIF